MNELITQIQGPIRGLLAQMYEAKEWTKEIFISSEANYYRTVADLKTLTDQKYISLSRRGKRAVLRILSKGQKEIK